MDLTVRVTVVVTTVCLFTMVLNASGQGLPPVPEGIAAEHWSGGPLTIKLNGVNPVSETDASLNYTVTNATEKNIRALVIRGVPGTVNCSTLFGGPLRPGRSETFSLGNVLAGDAPSHSEVRVDFVLFDDGSTWGPNMSGYGDVLMGIYDGRKAALADIRRLSEASGDDGPVLAWIWSPTIEADPPGRMKSLNTKWRKGYAEGYARIHQSIKIDFNRNGSAGIALRVAAIQRDLGMVMPVSGTKKDQ